MFKKLIFITALVLALPASALAQNANANATPPPEPLREGQGREARRARRTRLPARPRSRARHLPLGSDADRRRPALARHRPPDTRLSEHRRGLEDRPHAHLARPSEPVVPPALRAHERRGRDDESAGEALDVCEAGRIFLRREF